MPKARDIVTSAQPETMNHHHVVRDGSFWLCLHCRTTWPYPQPLPTPTFACIPRKWSDIYA